MAVNQSIYGNKTDWISIMSGSDVKLANFGDNKTQLKDGYLNQKLRTNQRLNNSIVHSALGSESALSNLYYYYQGEMVYDDHFEETQFCFATGNSCVASNRYDFQPSTTPSDTKLGMIAPVTSGSGLEVSPIINFNYKTLRASIHVAVSDTKNPSWKDVHSYNLRDYIESHTTEYPYIKYVFIKLFNKLSDGTYNQLNSLGQKGIIIFNNVSLYKFFRNSSTSTFGKCQSGLMIGPNVPSGYTPYTADMRILGITSEYGGASDTIGGINKRYVNSFTDGVTVETSDDGLTYCYREYDDGFEDYILHQTACFGIQFCQSDDDINIDIESEETTEEDANKIYIGVLDERFIGHGDYVQGHAILSTDQYDLDSADDSPFIPSADESDSDTGDLISDINNVTGGSGGHTIYNMTETMLSRLIAWANSEESGETGQNYFNYITSVKYSPFGFNLRGSDETVKINGHLVNVDSSAVTGIVGYRLDTLESSTFYFEREFNDFRDFEPYTRIALKIPFADTIQLTPSEWYGYGLKVVYTYDEMTGTGTAAVYKIGDGENLQYISMNCQVAIDVPLTVLNAGTYHNALVQAKTQRNSALIGVGVNAINVGSNIATGNGTGIALSSASLISSLESAKQSDYNLSHMTRPISHFSSASDMSQYRYTYKPNIIIVRPNKLPSTFNNEIYSRTVGHACVKTGKLSQFKGLTVVSDVDLSGFNATVEEKQMIESALKGGVIL